MTETVALEGVWKFFGRRAALSDVSFTVRRGEIVGLLGPNGSGKTTMLRAVAGYFAPDRGTVRVCGEAIGPDSSAVRRRVGYLPERPPLYESLAVRHYLAFVAAAKGLHGPARGAATDEAIAAFSLGEVASRRIGSLSKGFRQRVGLAQATLGHPEVLVLDEATNGLDPLQIVDARAMIRKGSEGKAVLFSSHLMQEVAALCHRVVILYRGRIVGIDRPGAASAMIELEVAGLAAGDGVALFAAIEGVREVAAAPNPEATAVVFRCTAQPGCDPRDALARAAVARGRLLALRTGDSPAGLEALFLDRLEAAARAENAA